ncbi:glycerate kinase [Candidatus Peregrinibacteria bacterium]|jgi:glycerate 2-kinase|nr:glycerate kinase [Candidatus Peregrinibacteria bacterium]
MTNILIATGSFKDVYSPMEACEMFKGILGEIQPDATITTIPMIDGGEYSSEVLQSVFRYEKKVVVEVVNPRGEKITSHYLKVDEQTVFIATSSILKLPDSQEMYLNPLKLTSYGFGQLISHAIKNGYKKLILGLGGTHTVDGGIGMAQALGVKFVGKDGVALAPLEGDFFAGQDMINIGGMLLDNFIDFVGDVEALCDATANLIEMRVPTNQKISSSFDAERNEIAATLENGAFSYASLLGISTDDNYFGTAGAILLSLIALFDPETMLGSKYFAEKFELAKHIAETDLVITGEGKIDNSLLGKSPIGVSRLAKKYGKKVAYVVGTVEEDLKKYFSAGSYLAKEVPEDFSNNGVTEIISGHQFYDIHDLPQDYMKRIEFFQENNPGVFEQGLVDFFSKYS